MPNRNPKKRDLSGPGEPDIQPKRPKTSQPATTTTQSTEANAATSTSSSAAISAVHHDTTPYTTTTSSSSSSSSSASLGDYQPDTTPSAIPATTSSSSSSAPQPAVRPPTPIVESTIDEVEKWLRWFLAKKTKLSQKDQNDLVTKLTTDGEVLLSFNEAQWRDIAGTALGSAIYNALHATATQQQPGPVLTVEGIIEAACAYLPDKLRDNRSSSPALLKCQEISNGAFLEREVTFSSLFELLVRYANLASGNGEIRQYSLPVITGASGSGKTRALIEIAKQYCSFAVAAGWLSAEQDFVAVLMTYNSGLEVLVPEPENGQYLRLLFSYFYGAADELFNKEHWWQFARHMQPYCQALSATMLCQIISHDSGKSHLLFGFDETLKGLAGLSDDRAKLLIRNITNLISPGPIRTFVVTTCLSPVIPATEWKSASDRVMAPLPIPALSRAARYEVVDEYRKKFSNNCQHIIDWHTWTTGGHPRSLEALVDHLRHKIANGGTTVSHEELTSAMLDYSLLRPALELPELVFVCAAVGTPVDLDQPLGKATPKTMFTIEGSLLNDSKEWTGGERALRVVPYIARLWAQNASSVQAQLITRMLNLCYMSRSHHYEEFMACFVALACGSMGRTTLKSLLQWQHSARNDIPLDLVDTCIEVTHDMFPFHTQPVRMLNLATIHNEPSTMDVSSLDDGPSVILLGGNQKGFDVALYQPQRRTLVLFECKHTQKSKTKTYLSKKAVPGKVKNAIIKLKPALPDSIDKLFGQDVAKVWAEHLAKKSTRGKPKELEELEELEEYQQLQVDQDKCFLVILSLQKTSEPGWTKGVITMAPDDVKRMVGPMWDTAPLFDPDCCAHVPEAQEKRAAQKKKAVQKTTAAQMKKAVQKKKKAGQMKAKSE